MKGQPQFWKNQPCRKALVCDGKLGVKKKGQRCSIHHELGAESNLQYPGKIKALLPATMLSKNWEIFCLEIVAVFLLNFLKQESKANNLTAKSK